MAVKRDFDALIREASSKRTGKESFEDLVEKAAQKRYSEDVKKVNSDYINSFLKDSNEFLSSSQKKLEGITWSSARDNYDREERYAALSDLGYRARLIGYYLENNGSELDKETYSFLVSSLGEYQSNFSKVDEAFKNANKFYSNFRTEDDYNFWSDHGTVENRQKWYSEQEDRLSKLKADRDAENSRWAEVDPIMMGAESMEYQTAAYEHTKRLDAINNEIAAIETEINNYKRGNYNDKGQYYGSKVVDDYFQYSQKSDFGAVSANREVDNPTREELTEYDARNDSSTWYYDENGVLRDAYGDKVEKDASGKWINPKAQGYAVKDRLGIYLNATEKDIEEYMGTIVSGTWGNIIGEGIDGSWDQLTENEIAIYYYLLNSSGQETADKYLSDMKTELNRRSTTAYNKNLAASYDDASLLEKIALNAASVPAQLFSGIAGTAENMSLTLRGEDINPYSAAHSGSHFSNTVRSETAEDFDATGIKIPVLDFTLGDAYQAGMSILDSYAAIGIGGHLGGALLASSAANSEATRLYEQGASMEQIALGSAAAGAAEMVFESLSIDKLINMKDAKTIGQAVKNALIQGGIEASEEGFTEIANIITNSVIMGNQSDWAKLVNEHGGNTWEAFLSKVRDVANAALGGFISGAGSAGGPSVAYATANYAQQQDQYADTGKTIREADGGVDALKQLANEVAGVSDAKMQKSLTKQSENVTSEKATGNNLVGKAVAAIKNRSNDVKVGRLYNAVERANNQANASANQADIVKSLQRKGFNTETANDIAEALVASYNGSDLTETQAKLLESAKDNKVVQEAISNIVTNTRSTMGQRSQNIRDFTNDIAVNMIKKDLGIDTASLKKTAEKEFTPTGEYEASAEGKAIRTDTSETIDIYGVASVRDGEMLLDIGDGKTINAKEVNYANEQDALIYEAIANLGSNIDAETANKLIAKYDGGDALVFARGMTQAYTYGFYGVDRTEMLGKLSLATELTEAQRNYAYGLGKQYRPSKDLADKAKARATKAPAEKGVYFRDKDGNATDISTYLKDSGKVLKDVQKTAIEAMRKMSEMMGVRFNVFESWVENGKRYYLNENGVKTEGNPNGFYDTRTGEVYIDINAGNNYEGTMLFTVAHELTHFMRQWSPEHFTKIARIVFQHGGMKGSVSELVALKQKKAEDRGKPISYDTAMEELVADGMETILKDGKVVEFMEEVKQKDQAAWEKIKGWFKNLAKFLRKLIYAYKNQSAQTVEGQRVAEFSEKLLHQIEQIWAEGAVASGENYQSSLTPGEEGVVVNESGDPVAYSTEDGSVLLSMRTYEEDGRKVFRNYLNKCVSSNKLTQAEMDEMLNGIEDIYQTCKEFKDKYAPFSSWSDAAVVRDTYGKPVFSVVTPNGDYKMNLDFSLVCKKRRTLDAVFNEMSKRGIIDDFELGQKSVVKINEIIRKYGLETACALCFVDAKRFRQASMADSFTRLYNELVESLVPEAQKGSIDYFNFSGYATIKKVEGGIDTWDNAKLDFSHINHVLKTYGSGTVEYKAAQYIKTHAEGRKLLLRGDFMSSQGFDAVKTQNKDILKLYNSKKGTGGPKAAFGDVQYMNEIVKKARTWTPAKAYSVGGVRIQSFSDYVPRMVFDYVQMVYDLAATKLPAHAYTKEALFVKQFGLTGIKINMSLIPAIAEGGIAPGLDANGNYVWAGESFDYETAKKIQNAEGYTENCGTICVGVSYEHIRKLLSDPDIRMVIPYHKSGLNPIVAHMNKIAEFTDYTTLKTNPGGCQNTMDKNGNKVEVDFNFNEVLRKTGDPKATVRQYLNWCAKNEYTPRFAEFAWHENYYKLIEDFTLYDKDGNYVPQREVRAVFPKETDAFGSMKDLIQEGLQEDAVIEGKRDKNLSAIVDEIQRTIPKTEAEISEEQVEQADKDLEAETKYSIRAQFYTEFDAWDGKKSNVSFVVGTTSDALKSIGMKDQKIKMHSGMMISKMNTHPEITRDIFRQVPELLEHPIVVQFSDAIDPVTKKPKYDDSITVLGELFAKVKENGKELDKPVLVAINLVPTKKNSSVILDFAVVKSAYTKDALQQYLNENSILYIDPDKKRTDSWLSRTRLSLPVGENRYGPIRKIAYVDGKVKVQNSKNMTAMEKALFEAGKIDEFGNKLFSDRDTESVSNRSLLANALEGATKNDIEKQKIQEYKGKIDLINSEEKKLRELNERIKELSFSKGPRDTKAIKDLQFEAKQAANRISTYDKQLLRLEASKPLQDVLNREKKAAYKRAEQKGKEALEAYKEKVTKTQRELLEKWQESRKKGVEGRKKTAMRHKIQSVVGELNQLLLSNDKKRHVPDSLKKAVADALSLVNMDTVAAEERAAKYAALIAKETDPDKIDAYTVTMENILKQGEKMGQRLKELRDAYEEIQNSDDPDIANAYDPVIAGSLNELAQSIGNTSLRDMTIDQLSDVYDMYKMVLTRVRDANKAFLNERNEAISALATRVVGEVRQAGGDHKYRASLLDPVRSFFWNNAKPVYAMEHIGSATMTYAYNNVRKGEDTWAKDVTEARAYYIDKSKKYGYDSWDFKKKYTFESTAGQKFELTLEQILSLYAYSKREQAHDHLRLGGFVFDSNIETYKEDGNKLIKYKVNTADAHQITPEILVDITGTLTKDQKAFVDEMQDYLSTVMGAKGNEVTMAMYGVKLFKEKFYFPLKSAKQFMFEQNEVSGEVKIKNSGFTNKVVAKANNPVILSNFMDVWANHVNDMSMYHSFVLPLEDFNRIFNYNSPKKEGMPPVSVKGTIQSAYSPAAVSYVKQLITDLNGGAMSDPRETIAKSLMAKFKKAKVFSSLSVVIQQPSSIGRAFALVDPKYFHFTKDGMNHDELWAELKQYAPVAIIKEMGYFDTNMGKSTQDFIKAKEYTTFKEKAKAVFTDSGYRDELLSKAPALADELSWCAIWNAVKRETAAKRKDLKSGSEEFLKAAGERFTEVVTKTQVYDSVLARSANMRSKSGMMSMITSFMAEPTTTINMLEDAIRKSKRGYKGYAARAFASAAVSVILNNALVSLVYGMRDDDEEETFAEKYMQSFVSGMIDDVNPLTYYPFVKDMWSILQGYDIERSDMSLVSDLADAMKSMVKAYTSEDGDVSEAWWTMAGSVANIGGIPMQNIRRDVNGTINFVKTLIEDVNGRATTGLSMGDALGSAVKDSLPVVGWFPGETKADKLYDAIISGDTAYVNRLKSGYVDKDGKFDQSKYDTAVRKALRENDQRIKEAAEARFSGDFSGYKDLFLEIKEEGLFTFDQIMGAINAEVNDLEKKANGDTAETTTDESENLFKVEHYYNAVVSNNKADAKIIYDELIAEKLADGYLRHEAEDAIATGFATQVGKDYMDGEISRAMAVRLLEENTDKGETDVKKWDFELEYGFSWGERVRKYRLGQLSKRDLIDAVMDIEGEDRESAEEYIAFLDLERANGNMDITANDAAGYFEYAEPAGIDIDVYLDYKRQAGRCESDRDANGKPISGSKKKKILAVIDSLNITRNQKDALYYANGYSESTLYEAPWH